MLGRQCDADHRQSFTMTVDDRAQLGAGFQSMRLRERLAQHDFVGAARLGQTALADIKPVQSRLAGVRHRNQQSADRVSKTGDVYIDLGSHPGSDLIDAGNLGNPPRQPLRCALEAGESVRQPVIAVIILLGGVQSLEGSDRHDISRHSAGDDQSNRQSLPPHPRSDRAAVYAVRCLAFTPTSPAQLLRRFFVSILDNFADMAVAQMNHPVGHIGDRGVMGDDRGQSAQLLIDALQSL